jgi:hypothetical protein
MIKNIISNPKLSFTIPDFILQSNMNAHSRVLLLKYNSYGEKDLSNYSYL